MNFYISWGQSRNSRQGAGCINKEERRKETREFVRRMDPSSLFEYMVDLVERIFLLNQKSSILNLVLAISTVFSVTVLLIERQIIVLHGCIATHPERFAINLICGSKGDKDKDIAFHFNARFDENCIVRNSMVNKKWGQRNAEEAFLSKGVPFNISIHVFPDHFQSPTQPNQRLGVSDGIKIELLRFDGFPVVYPGVPPPNIGFVTGEAHSQPPPPMYNPNVPLTAPIPGGISPAR
ncbi:hypothetical protein ScPMuIL_014062 [Solemya velum]